MSATNKTGRLWAFFGIFAVLSIWAISAAANFWAGYSLTHEPELRVVIGGASVAVDVMKAVSLFVVAAALANRKPVVWGLALVVFAVCSAWSLRSAVYASATIFGTAEAERALSETLRQSDVTVLSIQTDRAKFLSQQSIAIDAKNNSRRSVVEIAASENKRTSQDFAQSLRDIRAQQEKLKTVKAQPPTDPIAWLLDLDSTRVIQATCIAFAFILEYISGVGIWLITQARAPKPGRESRARAPSEPSGGEKMLPPVETKVFSAPNVVSLPVPSKLQPRNMLMEAVRDVVEPAGAKDRELVSVVRSRATARLPSDFEYCSHANVTMIVNELYPAARKKKTGGQMYFYGLKLKTASTPAVESRQAQA
jgi:hypothetical protein